MLLLDIICPYVVICQSIAFAFYHSSPNEITLVSIFDQLWTLSLDLSFDRLTSEIASCSKGVATHSKCCGIDLTLSGETAHEKKRHFVRRRVLFAPATHFPRWNYSYHSEQNWRQNLWSLPECDVSHLSRKANLLMYSAFAANTAGE